MASEESPSRRRKPSFDDNDMDVPSIKKTGSNRTLLTLLIGGAVAIVLLVCLVSVGIVAIVHLQQRDAQPERFVGSWKGRFVLHGQPIDTIYSFNKDGSLREDSFDLQGRRIQGGVGRWRIRNGEVEIDWGQGGHEIATATFPNANTMNYRIVQHTDLPQIGMSTTFRRQ